MVKRLLNRLRLLLSSIFQWTIYHAQSLVALASLIAIGVGLGWWVHPGAGILTVGAITFGLMVYAHERDMKTTAESPTKES